MVVTTNGLSEIVDVLIAGEFAKYIALGSGTTPPTAADTALVTEEIRKTATLSKPSTDTLLKSASLSTSEENGTVFTEIGDLDASSGGTLVTRETFTGVTKSSSQTWYAEMAYEFSEG